MSTPRNEPYKVEQREARASKRRVYPIWVSCRGFADALGVTRKVSVQGTRRCRAEQSRPRGKAAVKAAKRTAHAMSRYLNEQIKMTVDTILEEDPSAVVTKRIYGAAQ